MKRNLLILTIVAVVGLVSVAYAKVVTVTVNNLTQLKQPLGIGVGPAAGPKGQTIINLSDVPNVGTTTYKAPIYVPHGAESVDLKFNDAGLTAFPNKGFTISPADTGGQSWGVCYPMIYLKPVKGNGNDGGFINVTFKYNAKTSGFTCTCTGSACSK